jgi:hypothetical protein
MQIRHTVVFQLRHAPGSHEETDFIATAQAILPNLPRVHDFAGGSRFLRI